MTGMEILMALASDPVAVFLIVAAALVVVSASCLLFLWGTPPTPARPRSEPTPPPAEAAEPAAGPPQDVTIHEPLPGGADPVIAGVAQAAANTSRRIRDETRRETVRMPAPTPPPTATAFVPCKCLRLVGNSYVQCRLRERHIGVACDFPPIIPGVR